MIATDLWFDGRRIDPGVHPFRRVDDHVDAQWPYRPASPNPAWVAKPSVSAADVSAVDYFVDGKQLWVEHNTPYDYGGYAGSYLVTWFPRPGTHRFTVKVVTVGGKTASDTVTANVPVAPAPPAALAGTWRERLGAPERLRTISQPGTGDW